MSRDPHDRDPQDNVTLKDLADNARGDGQRGSDLGRRLWQIADSGALASTIVGRFASADAFTNDRIAVAAGMQVIGQIGEAVRHLPEAFTKERPQVPWAAIRGMRNRVSRGYDTVDPSIPWQALSVSVPALLEALRGDLPSED